MASKRALIIGIAGQDGSLLAELLLSEGYEVFGVVRQPTSTRFENLEPIRGRIELLQADVLDELSIVDVLSACQPQEVYNLASPSFVPMSWKQPVLTAEFAAVGVTALLEAIRRVGRQRPLLPGVLERDLRRVARGAADRGDAARSGDPVRSREGVRPLHHAQLPQPVRAARVVGDPLQPRVAATAARLRDPEDRPRSRRDQPRAQERAPARQPGRAPRLGVCGGLRARDVARACNRRSPTTT